MKRINVARRRFLRGLGGVMVGLPALDIFEGRALAQATPKKIYSALLLQQNGSLQGVNGEPDKWGPKLTGPLDAAVMMGADADQATSVLAPYASKINIIRGLNFHYSNNHNGGPLASSTGSPVVGSDTKVLPTNESYDFFVARTLTPGKEPLTLYVGRKGTYRDDCLSFSTGGVLRIGDNNPQNVYTRVMGLAGADPAVLQKLAARRLSVNDLIRNDLKTLLARTDLSKSDHDRLDLHLTSVREMEVGMTQVLGPALDTAGIMTVGTSSAATNDDNRIKVTQFMIDLIVFAFASDKVRTATLQIGGCNDGCQYTLNGVKQPSYHYISHRVMSDGGSGTAIPNAEDLHHQIDKIYMGYYKYFLDKMAAYTLPQGGTLLDSSVNLFTNSISDGPGHSGKNIPTILSGNAGGFLKTGFNIKTTGYTSRVLNTMITACGCRKMDGTPLDNFNDPQGTGLITEVVA
jgi:Protein of unknown function (DUF1552)